MTAPRPLTPDEAGQLLTHFSGDQQRADRLVECVPKAAIAKAVGIGVLRLHDGCTLTWATKRVFEHLQAIGTDLTAFLEAQRRPAGVSNGSEAIFLDAARHIARLGKDLPNDDA
jgi:hypothetical protein